MDTFELKREQQRLARKVITQSTVEEIRTVGGASTQVLSPQELLASVVVCEFPTFKILELKTFVLRNPLPYKAGFEAYREMPAIIEAYNLLDTEPDVLLVRGAGVAHPRHIGIASHVGVELNKATIGVCDHLNSGTVVDGEIILHNQVCGFEVTTRDHANPLYFSVGHMVSLEMIQKLIPQLVCYPHKLPEPLHLAHKLARKQVKEVLHV